MRMIALTLALVAAASPAIAGAPSWIVNKAGSRLGFTASMNGQSFSGAFKRWDARIRFDPKALNTSSVVAVIDTGSASTGDQTRDEALPTADWFSVAAFPRATFQANQFKDLGGGRYQAIGMLAIRDVKRPAILPFQLTINGKRATMRGSLTIDRRTFGLGRGQFANGDTVSTNVRIDIALMATAAG